MELKARSAEAAEAELTRFIERRDDKRRHSDGQRAVEEAWAASARRHAAELRAAARVEWSLYHEHMRELHTRLAQEHRHKAEKLCQSDRSPTEGEVCGTTT
jgi:hypothetical protein